MKTIFLDVGGYKGQTAYAALDPEFKIDKVYTFEPSTLCHPYFESLKSERFKLEKFGLGDKNSEINLYGTGANSASVYKNAHQTTKDIEIIAIRKFSNWLDNNVSRNDLLICKINCEGSECDILEDLISSGWINSFHSIVVDFDVRKIKGEEYRENEMRKKLKQLGISVVITPDVCMYGDSYTIRIQSWLTRSGIHYDLTKDEVLRKLFSEKIRKMSNIGRIESKIRRRLRLFATKKL